MDLDLHKRVDSLVATWDRLERKIDFLYRHLGLTFKDERPPLDEIEQLCADGNRVAAARLYGEKHKVGLLDAKRAVDDICAKLGIASK